MKQTIVIKRSSVAGRIPSELQAGELAVNLADNLLYTADTSGNIITLNAAATPGNSALKVASGSGTTTEVITMNEGTADKTLTVTGDGTYLTGAVSGSAGAPTVTISHADPTADPSSEITAAISGSAGEYAKDTEYTVLTGVKAQRDAKGHITGLTYSAQKVKDTNTEYTKGSSSDLNTGTDQTGKIWDAKTISNFVGESMANATRFRGGFNAGTGAIDGGETTLTSVAEKIGDIYVATTAGTFVGTALEVGDSIIFKKSCSAGTAPTSAHIIFVEGTVSVDNKDATLAWSTATTVATVEGTNIKVSLPANPNTDTKVTSVSNHYTPSGGTTKSAGGATGTSGTTVQVVTGVTCDAAGHVTGVTSGAATDTTYESKTAVSGGTDKSLVTTGEKYTWNNKSDLTLGNTATTALAGNTTYAGSSTQGGAATSAEKLTNTSKIGDTNQPVYFTANGVPTAISYTINKSVPSDAVFTDTTYTKGTSSDLVTGTDQTGKVWDAKTIHDYVGPAPAQLVFSNPLITIPTDENNVVLNDYYQEVTIGLYVDSQEITVTQVDINEATPRYVTWYDSLNALSTSGITVSSPTMNTPSTASVSSSNLSLVNIGGVYVVPTTLVIQIAKNTSLTDKGVEVLAVGVDASGRTYSGYGTMFIQHQVDFSPEISDIQSDITSINTDISTINSTHAGGTAVTLNGTSAAGSSASFYAPTSSGTEGQILAANASGVPTWTNNFSKGSAGDLNTGTDQTGKVWDAKTISDYVGSMVTNATHFKGGFNASTGAIDGGSSTMTSVAEKLGDVYTATTAGTFAGTAMEVGDSIIFKADCAAGTAPTSSYVIFVEGTVSVEDKGATLAWSTSTTVATVEGTNINVSLPANPNTDTKVTSVSNHYTPTGTTTKSASGATGTSGSTVQVVTGVTCDAAGHVTGVTSGAATDTTYESKTAVSGGTDKSLVTTGEKYTWNNKSNLTLGNTASTALAGNTKYAGSSTQGGAATSAEKLTNTSKIGDTNSPVYFTASGVPTAISYTIDKSVPSNAVFTDNSVTSVSNHYTPTGTTTKSASGATGTSGSTVQVVTGVKVDAAGHVTAVTSGAATDTTYSKGSTSDLITGTNQTGKVWDAKTIHDYVGPQAALLVFSNSIISVPTNQSHVTQADFDLDITIGLYNPSQDITITDVDIYEASPTYVTWINSLNAFSESGITVSSPTINAPSSATVSGSNVNLVNINGVYVVPSTLRIHIPSGTTLTDKGIEVEAVGVDASGREYSGAGGLFLNGEVDLSDKISSIESSITSLNNRTPSTTGTQGQFLAANSSGKPVWVANPNTDTKVTSTANHYAPATVSGQDKSASASGGTASWSIDVVKGVTLNTDGKGHVTGLSVTSAKIPGNPNTDRYVNSASFADDSTSTPASPVKMTLKRAGSDTATVTANIPKVSSASAGVAPKGAAVTTQSQSTKFLREDGTWAAPSYTKPGGDVTGPSSSTDARVAVFNGSSGKVIKDSGFTIAKSVPSNAVFTDTTYSSKSEASGGTDVSLVTTGEKYTWNHKSNLALGNTASTALPGNTKYAGASTQGGAATSAEKLTNTSKIGDTNSPVYFTASGVPTAISYTINKSVPSNAVFTDNSVTSVNNHYTPSGGTTKSASGASGTSGTTVQVVTGVTCDAAGHVTGVTSGAATDTNTTYSFSNGTSSTGSGTFTVTPSGGSAQTVTVYNIQPKVGARGSSTQPVYTSSAGTFATCNKYAGGTAVTLNGTSKSATTASFYAPTSAGKSGMTLVSDSTGIPVWTVPTEVVTRFTLQDISNNTIIAVSVPNGNWAPGGSPTFSEELQAEVNVYFTDSDSSNPQQAAKKVYLIGTARNRYSSGVYTTPIWTDNAVSFPSVSGMVDTSSGIFAHPSRLYTSQAASIINNISCGFFGNIVTCTTYPIMIKRTSSYDNYTSLTVVVRSIYGAFVEKYDSSTASHYSNFPSTSASSYTL